MADPFPEKFGKYRIVEEVGRGGFADVYKAIDTTLDRTVALKFLEPRLLREPTFVERFQREAKLAANLKHPNIVFIHEFGWEAGTVYIAMEFLEGQTLKEVILKEGALPPGRIVNMVEQIASALDHAHRRGLVHRDIKPSNIMVGADDHVTVMDFGIAKAATLTALTTTGRIFGTPEYMSPEQAEGVEEPDARSDIYSLGVVVYEMVTGKVPFSGMTPLSIMRGHADKPPPLPSEINPDISPAVEAILLKALAKKREERYQSAGEMARALTAAVETRAEPKVERKEKPATVRGGLPIWGWGVIALAAALLIGGAIFLAISGGEPTVTPVPVVQAITPTATVTATATPKPPTDTPTSTSTPTKTPTAPPVPTPTVIPDLRSNRAAQIEEQGTIRIGVHSEGLWPLSIRQGESYSGFEIDLAQEIVKRLFDDQVSIEWVPLYAAERMPALQSGEIDLLIRNTTHTLSREESGLWTRSYFLDGRRLLVRRDSGIRGIQDLDGATISVVADATNTELVLSEAARAASIQYTPLVFETYDGAFVAFTSGQAAAMISDWSYLLALTQGDSTYQVVGEILSGEFEGRTLGREPLAIGVPPNNPDFRDEVDDALQVIIESGMWQMFYDRWFPDSPPWTLEEMLAEPPANR